MVGSIGVLNEEEKYDNACKELANIITSTDKVSLREISKLKKRVANKYSLKRIPRNSDILRYIDPSYKEIRNLLLTKPVRSLSGIVIVALMTEPFECPHGRCIYCPHIPGAPISYTGKEPSAKRGIDNKFNPVMQIRKRLSQLEALGHSTDKIDIIIQGGTFNATPIEYREQFMLGVLEAILGYRPDSYENGLLAAEKSKYRIVGLAFETRPDYCKKEDIDWMLSKGATRVELGVQTIYDDVYRFVNRGHYIKDVVEATQYLKDSGLKVTYHLMPGLPLTDISFDIQMFDEVFNNPSYLPDHLKIYPTLVLNYTGILKLYELNIYRPLNTDDAIRLIAVAKHNFINEHVRIMRINRDIPSTEIIAGVDKTNLRQLVKRYMSAHKLRCRCIRCREVGHKRAVKKDVDPSAVKINIKKFYANRGIEYFISAMDIENDILIGFLRLRRPSQKAWREEIINYESYIVRELHVYGQALPIGVKDDLSWQHRGIGAKLLMTAEDIVSSEGGEKLLVISGVGVREYYYKLGYIRDGPYVSKTIV
jgi:elongator complex protein 3